ncbi:hypothetical protein RhiirB3_421084, partial [Rhizophagus irregularis]
MEFINAPIGYNNLVTKSHPKTCYKSRLLDFTSKKLNKILESEDSQTSLQIIYIKITSKKLNEILENENSQALDIKTD